MTEQAMAEVAEYEQRIAAALLRIGAGLARVRDLPVGAAVGVPSEDGPSADSPSDPAGLDALRVALDDERTANAQLEERIRQQKDRADARVAAMAAERDAALARLADYDNALQGLRESQAELGDTIAQLRTALAEKVAEPDLVNRAMQAEIEALRALRASDAAEVDALIAELRPIVEEAR